MQLENGDSESEIGETLLGDNGGYSIPIQNIGGGSFCDYIQL